MSVREAYRLHLDRQLYRLRTLRKGHELRSATDRTKDIRPGAVLAFSVLRNERVRLPYFLDYYRQKGIDHFLIVDNGSDDGSRDYLAEQPDTSFWTTEASYREARNGADWLNRLLRRYGAGHWTLVVDPDEFFIYPFCDTRPIQALTDWLEDCDQRSFGAMLIDMYPKGRVGAETYVEGQDPFEIASWFDSGNYLISRNNLFHNLRIQGGPRARALFADQPEAAPSLNKIPLVKWRREYVYAHSTQMLLPRRLNRVYDADGGEMTSGALLHANLMDSLGARAAEDVGLQENYRGASEHFRDGVVLWNRWSEKYISWRQLEILGLMSKGNWA